MNSDIYWIREENLGDCKLGTMARPRGNDWLEDEIKWMKIKGVDILVSLLETIESNDLGLENEELFCENKGIEFINFPIRDVQTPKNESDFCDLVNQLTNRIKAGKSVVIHCRMGIGRASILAAAILMKFEFNSTDVFDIISKYRKLKVPDTDEQRNWLISMESKLNQN